MAVTKLIRKEARIRAKQHRRNTMLKLLNKKNTIPSPYKGQSGIVLEDMVALPQEQPATTASESQD